MVNTEDFPQWGENMGPVDLLVIATVAVLLALAVRSIRRSGADGCSGCGSKDGCAAHVTGGPCPAAQRMLKDVEKNLDR